MDMSFILITAVTVVIQIGFTGTIAVIGVRGYSRLF